MSIFVDSGGLPTKFFIQKDLPEDVQARLAEKITALGGRVEQKVPRAGYILVQFGTPEEERLSVCWRTPDRPERFFVPFTYVDACEAAGRQLKQIFMPQGYPIRFHIDSDIANVNFRAELSDTIRHAGGDPTATSPHEARVIIADEATDTFQHLVKTYQGVPDKYIETIRWVEKCVETGELEFTPVVYKNPGGRRAGEERTQFTTSDEEHLCEWIAAKIPYKETGGRTGNRLYQQLVEMANNPDYSWVLRHTWQSWRERYKKNSARLDGMIARIVEERRPGVGEKGQYGYVRMSEDSAKKSKRGKRDRSPPSGQQLIAGPSEQPVHMPMMHNGMIVYHPGSYFPPPGTGPMDPVPPPLIRHHSGSFEAEDNSAWAIRVGNATPPAWARREQRREEDEEASPRKRPRLESAEPVVIDIASAYRFTVEEVEEYYISVGQNAERTRRRFEKMRAVLNAMTEDE